MAPLSVALERKAAISEVRRQWGWPALTAIAVLLPLFSLELVFLGASLLKVHPGGYVPILIAGTLITMITSFISTTSS